MPNINEIKKRIEGAKSTKKITRAMYLISVSKSKKARIQMNVTRPYFKQINETLADILASSEQIESPYLAVKDKGSRKSLCVVLAGDKGMAGGYNYNIINLLEKQTDRENTVYLVAGTMGRQQMIKKGFNVDESFVYPVMNPTVYLAREVAEICSYLFMSDKYYEVNIVYTKMITPIRQDPMFMRLLPFAPETLLSGYTPSQHSSSLVYEPNPAFVFNHLARHYLKGVIYGAFVEAFTSEQCARTYAMDNATKSAQDMIEKLEVMHNRARQAKITQEITEIMGGIPAK